MKSLFIRSLIVTLVVMLATPAMARRFHNSWTFVYMGFNAGEDKDYTPEQIQQTGIIPETGELRLICHASYEATDRLNIYATVPFGGIWTAPPEWTWQPPSKLNVGDVAYGTNFVLAKGKGLSPSLKVNFEIGEPTARGPASGGFFKRTTYGAEITQPLSSRVALFVNASQTERSPKEGITPGSITSVGGGLNFYSFSGASVSIWTIGYQSATSDESLLPAGQKPSSLTSPFESSQVILGWTIVSLNEKQEPKGRLGFGFRLDVKSKIGGVIPVKKTGLWMEIGN